MVFHRVIAIALAFVQVSAAANVTWEPCSTRTIPIPGYDDGKYAECTVYKAPLCHPGICEAPDSASSTVDVFVKRIRAAKGSETATNVWLIQGGTDYTLGAFDDPIIILYAQLNGRANVHTMDHRGTGQSTHLTRKELQADGGDIDTENVPGCAKELGKKYGDLAAFSTTSAATDLATFISDYGNDFSTTVYGVGYGTIWAERVMQLDPPKVTGYVLDRVFTTSGSTLDRFMNITSSTAGFGEVSDDFLDFVTKTRSAELGSRRKGSN